jgi:hypothetical protein
MTDFYRCLSPVNGRISRSVALGEPNFQQVSDPRPIPLRHFASFLPIPCIGCPGWLALTARCLRVERRMRLRVVLAGDESFLDPETEYLKLLEEHS